MGIVRSEIEVMGIIKKEGKATVRRIVEVTGFSHNYIRYLCKYLTGRGLLSKVAPRTYELTPEGGKAVEEAVARPSKPP